MKKFLSILGVSLLSLALLSGCGDSDETTEQTTTESSFESSVKDSESANSYNASKLSGLDSSSVSNPASKLSGLDSSSVSNPTSNSNSSTNSSALKKDLDGLLEDIENLDIDALLTDTIKNFDYENFDYQKWERAYLDFFAPCIAVSDNADVIKEASMPEVISLYKEILSDFGKILANTDKLNEYAVKLNAVAKANNITVKPISSLNDLMDSVDDMENTSDMAEDSELMQAYYDFYAPFIAIINNITSLDKSSQTEFKTICQEFTVDITNNMTNPSKLGEYAVKLNSFAKKNHITVKPITSEKELLDAVQNMSQTLSNLNSL